MSREVKEEEKAEQVQKKQISDQFMGHRHSDQYAAVKQTPLSRKVMDFQTSIWIREQGSEQGMRGLLGRAGRVIVRIKSRT